MPNRDGDEEYLLSIQICGYVCLYIHIHIYKQMHKIRIKKFLPTDNSEIF